MVQLNLSVGDSLHERENLYDCLESEVKFDDAYVLGDEIAAGSFGTVYYTHHVSESDNDDKKQFAVKVIERDAAGEADTEAIHESTIMLELRTVANIIQLKDFYMDRDNLYIVQDLAMGGDVFDRLAMKDIYTEKEARDLCEHLIATVGYMHDQKILHRDLKPENLLLQSMDDDANILLCDFGMAGRLPENIDDGFQTMVGTPAYVAPEIINGDVYREKVDVWAVGCIIYVLLSGYLPFGDSEDPDVLERIAGHDYDFEEEQWDCVSGSARKLISSLLEPDVNDRPTLSEALKSRWFKKCGKKMGGVKLQKSLTKIKKIVRHRKLRTVITAVKFSNRMLMGVNTDTLKEKIGV